MKDRPDTLDLARDGVELLLRSAERALRFLEMKEEGELIRERAFACLDRTFWQRFVARLGIARVSAQFVGAEQSMHETWAHRRKTVADVAGRLRALGRASGSPYRAPGEGRVTLTDSEYGRLNLWIMQAALWQSRTERMPPAVLTAHDPVYVWRHMPSLWPVVTDFWRRFSAS